MSPNKPDVSVVIPSYNYAHFLKRSLGSLVSQTFANWEALVINNFSADNTVEVVESFSDRRIRLVNFRNNGIIASSRNKGIELSCSSLIAFLDADDFWYPEKLAKCLEEFNAGADLVCHGMRYIVNGRFWKNAGYKVPVKTDFFSLLYRKPQIFTSSVIVRKECLRKAGGFDENPDIVTAEDYDLWLRLFKAGACFRFIKNVLGEYNCHSDSFSRKVSLHIQASLNVINKNLCAKRFMPLYNFKVRKAKALFFYGIARNFQREGKRLRAFLFFLKTLAFFPFLLSPYAGLLLNMLPYRFSNSVTHDLKPEYWLNPERLKK